MGRQFGIDPARNGEGSSAENFEYVRYKNRRIRNMAAHELAKKWKSLVAGGDDKEFDLTLMKDDGKADPCNHNGRALTGVTDKLNVPEAPDARYLVRLDEDITARVHQHYRGVAIWDPNKKEISKIIGVTFITRTFFPFTDAVVDAATKRKEEAAIAAAPQDEATWVATKNP
jgi:hypothetical protein